MGFLRDSIHQSFQGNHRVVGPRLSGKRSSRNAFSFVLFYQACLMVACKITWSVELNSCPNNTINFLLLLFLFLLLLFRLPKASRKSILHFSFNISVPAATTVFKAGSKCVPLVRGRNSPCRLGLIGSKVSGQSVQELDTAAL